MFWSKNKALTSEEYEKLARICADLQNKCDHLEQLVRSLRGLVNKKLGFELTEPVKQNERVINDVLLPN